MIVSAKCYREINERRVVHLDQDPFNRICGDVGYVYASKFPEPSIEGIDQIVFN
jgi:hypothetical protein